MPISGWWGSQSGSGSTNGSAGSGAGVLFLFVHGKIFWERAYESFRVAYPSVERAELESVITLPGTRYQVSSEVRCGSAFPWIKAPMPEETEDSEIYPQHKLPKQNSLNKMKPSLRALQGKSKGQAPDDRWSQIRNDQGLPLIRLLTPNVMLHHTRGQEREKELPLLPPSSHLLYLTGAWCRTYRCFNLDQAWSLIGSEKRGDQLHLPRKG